MSLPFAERECELGVGLRLQRRLLHQPGQEIMKHGVETESGEPVAEADNRFANCYAKEDEAWCG